MKISTRNGILIAVSIIIILGAAGVLLWCFVRRRNYEGYALKSPWYCGVVKTDDPRVFGPHTWPTFHVMAQNYPIKANSVTAQHCTNFLRAIPFMLPCNDCGNHFREFLNLYTKLNPGVNICSGKNELVKFLVEAHNNVSKRTHPDRKLWTSEDAAKKYSTADVCFHSGVWRGPGICRKVAGCRTDDWE